MSVVSVIITCHNYARFLSCAINSVINQRLHNTELEVLVIDDGSVDNTREIAGRFGERIHYAYQDNMGQAAAINLGVKMATGTLVCMLDADDWYYDTKVAAVIGALERVPSASLIHHRQDVVNEVGHLVKTSPLHSSLSEGTVRDALLKYGGTHNAVVSASTSALSFPRPVLDDLMPIPEAFRTAADGYLITQAALRGPFAAVHKSLGCYRLHGGNSWNTVRLSPDTLKSRHIEVTLQIAAEVNSTLVRQGSLERVHPENDRVFLEHLLQYVRARSTSLDTLKTFIALIKAIIADDRCSRRYRLHRFSVAIAMVVVPLSVIERVKLLYSRHKWIVRLREKYLPRRVGNLTTLDSQQDA